MSSDTITTRINSLIDDLEKVDGKGKPKAAPVAPKKPVNIKTAFFTGLKKRTKRKGQVEFAEFGFGNSPDGMKHYFTMCPKPKDPKILKDIPEIDTFIKPDLSVLLTVLLAIENNKPTLLFGKPGTGKTTYVKLVAALLQYPYMRLSGMEGIEVADIVGQVGIQDGDTKWEDGDLSHAVRHGYLVADDEPFKNSAGVNMAKQWLTEADSPQLKLVGNHEERSLPPHKQFRIVMCDNVRGTGDGADSMAATAIQDASSINRLAYKIHVNYLPAEEEVLLITHRYPQIKPQLARKMVQLGNTIRAAWDNGTVEMVWSVRQLMEWSEAALTFEDPSRAFNIVYYAALNDDEKGVVQRLWSDVGFEGLTLHSY